VRTFRAPRALDAREDGLCHNQSRDLALSQDKLPRLASVVQIECEGARCGRTALGKCQPTRLADGRVDY
jgi:hypothetical protein